MGLFGGSVEAEDWMGLCGSSAGLGGGEMFSVPGFSSPGVS